MNDVLALIQNDEYIDSLKETISQNNTFHSASDADDALNLLLNIEILVCIADYDLIKEKSESFFEGVSSFCKEPKFVLLFDENNVRQVLDLYNKGQISRLVSKDNFDSVYIGNIINSVVDDTNGNTAKALEEEKIRLLNEQYVKPMNEMSALLNERLYGYENINKVFVDSLKFILDYSDKSINTVCDFADKLIKDYVQTYLITEPDIDGYFSRIEKKYNKPKEKKYFKLEHDEAMVTGENKYKLLFLIDTLSLGFDIFYPLYRGKISIKVIEDKIDVNSIYEVRKDPDIRDVYELLLGVIDVLLDKFALDARYGVKGDIIQFRATISNS